MGGTQKLAQVLGLCTWAAVLSTAAAAWKPGVAATCEGASKGPRLDLEENGRCFTYCYGQVMNIDGMSSFGYRSCCGMGQCFQVPTEVLPLGRCQACNANGAMDDQPTPAFAGAPLRPALAGVSSAASLASRQASMVHPSISAPLQPAQTLTSSSASASSSRPSLASPSAAAPSSDSGDPMIPSHTTQLTAPALAPGMTSGKPLPGTPPASSLSYPQLLTLNLPPPLLIVGTEEAQTTHLPPPLRIVEKGEAQSAPGGMGQAGFNEAREDSVTSPAVCVGPACGAAGPTGAFADESLALGSAGTRQLLRPLLAGATMEPLAAAPATTAKRWAGVMNPGLAQSLRDFNFTLTPGGGFGRKGANGGMDNPFGSTQPGTKNQTAGTNTSAPSTGGPPEDVVGGEGGGPPPGGVGAVTGLDIPMVTRPVRSTPSVPIANVDELSGLTEKQLFDVFTQGVPDVPSNLPGERGKFAICNRTNTLLPNSFGTRPYGWENASFPYADNLFNFFQSIWHGKVLYTDPATGTTRLWNLLLDQGTVDVLATVTAENNGISKDKKPSVVIDYGVSDIPAARVIRDEMRRVGPTAWLGRAFFINPVIAALPTSKESQWIVDLLQPFIKASETAVNFVGAVANATAATPITTPPPGYLPITLFFAVECESYYAPKLHYFPLLAEPLTEIQRLTGYVAPVYDLPSLTGPSGADPNAALLPQKDNAADIKPFVLLPTSLVDDKPIKQDTDNTFAQLPASTFTRIFGSSWLPNLPVRKGWNPTLPPQSEGFAKGQASIADTMVYDAPASGGEPDFAGKGL